MINAGATTPAITAPSKVNVADWQDATIPLIVGNKSRTSKVAPGATSDMPNV
jgi:hypothetical protein